MDMFINQFKRMLRVIFGFPSMKSFISDLKLLLQYLSDYSTNRYRTVSPATLFTITVGFIYLISPIDLLPDVIPILGWIDDIAVLRIIIEMVRGDIQKYRLWKNWINAKAEETFPKVE